VKKLGICALLVLAVVVIIAIAVNRIPTSPFASLHAGARRTPAAAAEYVARLGDCVACHSMPDGEPFAGGFAPASQVLPLEKDVVLLGGGSNA